MDYTIEFNENYIPCEEVENRNGKIIRPFHFKNTLGAYFKPKLISLKKEYTQLFFSSSLKEILNFLKENNFYEVSFNETRCVANIKSEDRIFYLHDFKFTTENLTLDFGVSIDYWDKNFGIKDYKKYLSKNIKEIELFNYNLVFNYQLSSLDELLTLKEVLELSLNKLVENAEELEKKYLIKIKFEIDKNFRTAMKQYIIYFSEYLEETKGVKINFEVENYKDNLILKFTNSKNFDEIKNWFKEYMNFLKYENIDDISPIYSIDKKEFNKKIETLILRDEINKLKDIYEKKLLILDEVQNNINSIEEEYNYQNLIKEIFDKNIHLFEE